MRKEHIMAMRNLTARTRDLGIFSLILGCLGLAFFWWTPFGMILSLAGLTLGVVAWDAAPVRSGSLGWLIGGTLLSAAALALNLIIAVRGLELIQFGAFR
jgi:hypothetical protein